MFTGIACLLSLLIGLHVGATWPDLAVARRITRLLTRQKEPLMPHRIPRRLLILQWTLLAAIALTLATAWLLIDTRDRDERQAREFREYVTCTTDYLEDFATAYEQRIAAGPPVSAALDEVAKAVRDRDPVALDRAVARYLKVRATQDAERRRNPYPELPEVSCGQAPEEP